MDKTTEFVAKPIRIVDEAPTAQHVTFAAINQTSPHEYTLILGQVEPPLLLGDLAARQAQAIAVDAIPMHIVFKGGFSRERLLELAVIIQDVVNSPSK